MFHWYSVRRFPSSQDFEAIAAAQKRMACLEVGQPLPQMMALTKFCETNSILAHTLRNLSSVVVSFMDYGNAAVAKLIGNAAKSCRCADVTFEQNRQDSTTFHDSKGSKL